MPGRAATAALLAFLGALAGCAGDPPAGPQAGPPAADRLPAGRWREANGSETPPTPEQQQAIAELQAIGYLAGSREPAAAGVTVNDQARAAGGRNLFASGHGPEALLIDMDGKVLHRWYFAFEQAFPGSEVPPEHVARGWWRRVHLFANGDLLAIFEGLGILKLRSDSTLIWARPLAAHHDLEVTANGDLWVLTRQAHLVPRVNDRQPIVEDFISLLDSGGEERRRISVLECVEGSPLGDHWRERGPFVGDIFHTNSLALLDGRLADRLPEFAAGNLLISMSNLNAIAVVDPERQRVVWSLQGAFKHQHDPKVLPNRRLMLFDNDGRGTASSVIELDPATGQILWAYRGTPERPFYSKTLGTAERLANGNTLITESDNGRVFEVTPDQEIVWEYYNPHRAGPNGEYIATIPEMVRLAPDFPVSWAATRRASRRG